MKKVIYLPLIMICLSIINVKALEECTTSELARLKELANNVRITYDYKIDVFEDDEDSFLVNYDINIINTNEDLKISYQSNIDDKVVMLKEGEETITGFYQGETLIFKVYAYTANKCVDKLLRIMTVNLPMYNRYYYFNKDTCREYPEFKYCKEFMDTQNLSFQTINEKFDEYKKELAIKNVSNMLKNNFYYIIAGIVIIIAIVLFFIIRKHKMKKDADLWVK